MNDRSIFHRSEIAGSKSGNHESKPKKYLFHVNTGSISINVIAENLTQVVNQYPEADSIENQGGVTIL